MVDEKDWQKITIKMVISHDGSAIIFRLPSGNRTLGIEVYEDPFNLTVRYINKDTEQILEE